MIPEGPVVVFDDDDYYLGGVLAEKLIRRGCQVFLVTPAPVVSAWTAFTLEQEKIQKRLIELGVEILANHNLQRVLAGEVELACVFTDRLTRMAARSVVMVTARLPIDELYHDLAADPAALHPAGIRSVTRIGDCVAPGTIAHAVYSGHRFAREFEEPLSNELPFRTEPVYLNDRSS